MQQYDCIIVGSGINALVCAALLTRKGRKILLLERNDRLGGCIRTDELTAPGFVHDVMSSWHPLFITSPGYAELKEDLERYGLEYCHTDSPTAVVLPDQTSFVLKNSRQENIRNMNGLCSGDGDRYAAAMAQLEQTLGLSFTLLGSELWRGATLKTLLTALMKLGPFGLAQYFGAGLQPARGWLDTTFSSGALRACLAGWPSHAGIGGPDAPTSALIAQVIAFTLESAGCPIVRGGSFRLVQAFQQLIEAGGGELQVNADVIRVITEKGRAIGVKTRAGAEYRAHKVLCSVTPNQLYESLLDPAEVPAAVAAQTRAYRYGNGDMQIHLALSEPPAWQAPGLESVAITHITSGADAVARAISEANCGLLPQEATIVVGQPAALDPSRAPAGKGLLWIQLQECPRRIKGDAAGNIETPEDGAWNETVRERYADRIIERLARHIPGLKDTIIARTVLSPADLERLNVNLVGGDPYGGACTLDQFFLWRPLRALKNHATPVKNLYHIGASTHPGPGLGGGSGYLVAQKL